jgi:DNA-binding CsgD family transcriptional regulator
MFAATAMSPPDLAGPPPRLTPRQHAVMILILSGRSTKQAARELGMSRHTADNHRQAVLRRTGCRGTICLLRSALKWGWVQP